jgi:transcriptional regulator with XRE-family HTH domain
MGSRESPDPDGSSVPNRRAELAEYLRARRSSLNPIDLGLAAEPRRRVRGLRREEVADRAGISLEYYVRLEQGRNHQISEQVLSSLARALLLDDDGRAYLYRLALPSPSDLPRSEAAQPVSDVVMKLLDQWSETPAYVFDSNQDIVVVNDLAAALSPGYSVRGNNLVLMLFTATTEQRENAEWRDTAERAVAALRFHGDATDPRMAEVVESLSLTDADFRRMWAGHQARPLSSGIARNFVPDFGWVDLPWQILDIPGGYFLNVALIEPGTRAGAAIAQVAASVRQRRLEDDGAASGH